jgi:hypothetical protein
MAEDTGAQFFDAEYRQELTQWLQRRLRYLCITFLVLGSLNITMELLFAIPQYGLNPILISLVGDVISMGVICIVLLGRSWRTSDRERILRAATRMILIVGFITIIQTLLFNILLHDAMARGSVDPAEVPDQGLLSPLVPLFFWHFFACLFLPWTARESLRAFIPLLGFLLLLMVGLIATGTFDPIGGVMRIIFSPAILLPGMGICAWRMNRHSKSFRMRMFGQHFTVLRRELSQARQIHESMFPARYDDGCVKFDYMYKPMSDLGGDFVHFFVGAEGVVHLTLIDVTGHGLAAALTVNRLYGELERIRAENPRAQPDEVITLLNRYIALTMARHNIFATGVSLMLDPYEGQLLYVSAGHPPLLLRGANGSVSQLSSTTIVLGAVSDEEFDPHQQSVALTPGDVVVAYTDGVTEARDRAGRMYGTQRLNDLMIRQPPPRSWPQFVSTNVGKHLSGAAEDDVLVASLAYLMQRATVTSTEPQVQSLELES